MEIKVFDLQIDDANEAEMAAHGVDAEEVYQVLDSGAWTLKRNHGPQADLRPYIMVGLTENGRLLYIPIQPVDRESGLWRPATAFTPS